MVFYLKLSQLKAWFRLLASVGTAIFCLMGAPAAKAVTISAGIEPTTINLGQSATLKITYTDGSPSGLPAMPSVPNLNIIQVGQSREIILIGGRQSSSHTLVYQVVPSQAGIYTIPPITCMVGNDPIPTSEMRLIVQNPQSPSPRPQAPITATPTPAPAPPAPTPPPPQQPAGPEPYFIRMIIPRNELYIGEIFPVEIQLFYLSGENIQLPNLRFDGFTVNRMIAVQQTRQMYNNAPYWIIVFKSVAVPVKAGLLNFGPAECNLTVPNPGGGLRQVSPQSEVLKINVLPLPAEGVPAGFRGAVGNYSMNVTAGPTDLSVGDPITLKVQIMGRGAMDNVLLPSLDDWRDFKNYPPIGRLDMPDILSMSGIKSFEQIVVPQNAEIKQVPAITFSFFDPEQKTYRTLSQGPFPITVRPHGGAAQQPTIVTNVAKVAPVQTDLVHIKTYSGALGAIGAPLLQRPWFLALQIVPVGLWAGLYLRRRQIETLANNPRLRRHREVQALVAKGLVDLRELASYNQAEAFYATAFRLLQEQLGERFDLPASAITESIVDERLLPLQVPPEVRKAVHDAFDICNRARYAREGSAHELAALADQFATVISQLQSLPAR